MGTVAAPRQLACIYRHAAEKERRFDEVPPASSCRGGRRSGRDVAGPLVPPRPVRGRHLAGGFVPDHLSPPPSQGAQHDRWC